jgi:hypothetical protein
MMYERLEAATARVVLIGKWASKCGNVPESRTEID